ncbi:MAG: FMN-binding protein [Gammaproteobacteria bacterium]
MNGPEIASNLPVTQAASSLAMTRTLGLVSALAGFLVVMAFQITKPMIEENKRLAIEQALYEIMPSAVSRRDFIITAEGLLPVGGDRRVAGSRIYAGYDQEGKLVGLGLEAAAQGYQDVIQILFSYDPACQCIRGIKVLKMAETPGIGDKIAKDEAFQKNFVALDASLDATAAQLTHEIVTVKHGTKKNPWEIDAITGATISSKAVGRMLNDSAQRLLPDIMRQLAVLKAASGEHP